MFFDDFVVVRQPVLPFDNIYLGEPVINDLFLKGLLIASPDFYRQYKVNSGKRGDKNEKESLTFRKFVLRSSYRCTPYGLFASVGHCSWSSGGVLPNISSENMVSSEVPMSYYNPYFELDHDVLEQLYLLVLEKMENPKLKINGTLYSVNGQLRYIANVRKVGSISWEHNLKKINTNELIRNLIFDLKGQFFSRRELKEYIENLGASETESQELIFSLEEEQIAIAASGPSLTSVNPLASIMEYLTNVNEGNNFKDELSKIEILIKKLNNECSIEEFSGLIDNIYNRLLQLGVTFNKQNILNATLENQFSVCQINDKVKGKLISVMHFLYNLNSETYTNPLDKFKFKFIERYGSSRIDLLQLFDPDVGFVYNAVENQTDSQDPLIKALLRRTQEAKNKEMALNQVEQKLLKLVLSKSEKDHLQLDDGDLEFSLKKAEVFKNFPETMSVVFKILPNQQLQYVVGNPGASKLIARFGFAVKGVDDLLQRICDFEKECNNEDLVAEIIHRPASRTTNILKHPEIRDYEIPVFTVSSRDIDCQLPLSDLQVVYQKGKFHLWSKRLKKVVVPRLSNAHNFRVNSLPIYNFLCDIQDQDSRVTGLSFQWGKIPQILEILPRVSYNGVILFPKSWYFKVEKNLFVSRDFELTIQNFTRAKNLPRIFSIVEGDNILPINLNIIQDKHIFFKTLRKYQGSFIEIHEIIDEKIVDGYFKVDSTGLATSNELIATFYNNYRKIKRQEWANEIALTSEIDNNKSTRISFSKCMYFKVYANEDKLNFLLINHGGRIEKWLKTKGIKKWFFIRYKDPKVHLRFRFFIPINLDLVVLDFMEEFHRIVSDAYTYDSNFKIQIEHYEPEVERYGHFSMELTESFFTVDSSRILKILKHKSSFKTGINHLLFVGCLNMIYLFRLFELDLEQTSSLVQIMKDSFQSEFTSENKIRRVMDSIYRENQHLFESIATNRSDHLGELVGIEKINKAYEKKYGTILNELFPILGIIPFTKKIGFITDMIHMSTNRLFPKEQRAYEYVSYYLLDKYFKSEMARRNVAL